MTYYSKIIMEDFRQIFLTYVLYKLVKNGGFFEPEFVYIYGKMFGLLINKSSCFNKLWFKNHKKSTTTQNVGTLCIKIY